MFADDRKNSRNCGESHCERIVESVGLILLGRRFEAHPEKDLVKGMN